MARLLTLLILLFIVVATLARDDYRVSMYHHTGSRLHLHPHPGHIHIGTFCALFGWDVLDDAIWVGYDGPVSAQVIPVIHDPSIKVQMNPPWNLDRIDQPSLPLDGLYKYPISAGNATTVYVLDSGVDTDALDAVFGASFISNQTVDDYGHGTHVAGVIGHETYGVAKSVEIIAVKILNDKGTGKWSNVLRALEWIVKHHNGDPRLGIVNLSLSGAPFPPVVMAIHAMTKLGFHIVVSAGNGAKDACGTSPANAPDAFRVGASDASDEIASMSNYGDCVDIYAPGVDIVSVFPKSLPLNRGLSTRSLSGTSMAAPHVSGVIALLQSVRVHQAKEPLSPAEMKRLVTSGRIRHILYNNPPEIDSEEADAIQEARGQARDGTNTAIASAQSAGTIPMSISGSKGRKDNDGTLATLERQRSIAAGSPPNAGGNSAKQPVNWDEIQRQRRIVQTKFGSGKRVESQETDGA